MDFLLKVDWSPLAGLTGTRPVVDRYSVTRYSDAEWKRHNMYKIGVADDEIHRANMYVYWREKFLTRLSFFH